MMSLSVDVVGNSPADCHEFGPGTDHRQPPFRAEDRNDLFQAHTRLTLHDTFLLIEIEEMIQSGADGNIMVIVDCLVTITSAQSAGNQRRIFEFRSQVFFNPWE